MDHVHSTTTEHQKGKHLSYEERILIQLRLKDNWSADKIAKEIGCAPSPSSVEVLGNFRRLHFFLALMSHTTCPAILDFSTKILCPFWAFFY